MFRMHIEREENDLYITVGSFDDDGNLLGRRSTAPDFVNKYEIKPYFADAEPGVLELAHEVMSNKKEFAIVELIPRVLHQ